MYFPCRSYQLVSNNFYSLFPTAMNVTTCTIVDPMLVSAFSRSTSYTFMGSCEHALLQSCDDLVDFMVRTDFITDSMDNGAVGVFIVSGLGGRRVELEQIIIG